MADARARGTGRGRGRLRVRHLRRHAHHARSAQAPQRPEDRPGRRRQRGRTLLATAGAAFSKVDRMLYPEARAAVEAAAADPPMWSEGYDVAAARDANRAFALREQPEDVAEVVDLDADGVR